MNNFMGGYSMEEILKSFLEGKKEEEVNRERNAVVTSIVDYLLALGLIDNTKAVQLGGRLIELLVAFEDTL